MDPIESTPFLPTQIEKGPHESFLAALLVALTNTFIRSAQRVNGVYPKDGTEAMEAPVKLRAVLDADLTTDFPAADWSGSVIYVSDGSGGTRFRGSNGTSWVNLG